MWFSEYFFTLFIRICSTIDYYLMTIKTSYLLLLFFVFNIFKLAFLPAPDYFKYLFLLNISHTAKISCRLVLHQTLYKVPVRTIIIVTDHCLFNFRLFHHNLRLFLLKYCTITSYTVFRRPNKTLSYLQMWNYSAETRNLVQVTVWE